VVFQKFAQESASDFFGMGEERQRRQGQKSAAEIVQIISETPH